MFSAMLIAPRQKSTQYRKKQKENIQDVWRHILESENPVAHSIQACQPQNQSRKNGFNFFHKPLKLYTYLERKKTIISTFVWKTG
jgi:hypothetical protein